MPARALSSSTRPNESQFVSDLANLFRRHHVRCGEPQDLDHLATELAANSRLCDDLFLLCTAISHMGEADLSPEELLVLIARAVAGPRASYGDEPKIPDTTRSVFLDRYTRWTERASQARPATLTDDDGVIEWPRSKTQYTRAAAALSQSALSEASGPTAQAETRITPNTPIGDLTLRELSEYLIDLERRVKRAEGAQAPEDDTPSASQTRRKSVAIAACIAVIALAAGYEYLVRGGQDLSPLAASRATRIGATQTRSNDLDAYTASRTPLATASTSFENIFAANRTSIANQSTFPMKATSQRSPAAAAAPGDLPRTPIGAAHPSVEPIQATSASTEPDAQPVPITRVAPELPQATPPRQIIESNSQRSSPEIVPIERQSPPLPLAVALAAPSEGLSSAPAGTAGATVPSSAKLTIISVPSTVLMKYALSAPPPRYPMNRHINLDTAIVVRARISKEGQVTSATAISGADDLRSAAEEAVQHWRFRPYLLDGSPTEVSTQVTFLFKAQ